MSLSFRPIPLSRSAAVVGAVTALTVAFSGVAVVGSASASPDSQIREIKKAKVKKIAKREANRAIARKVPTIKVLSADTAAPIGPAGGDLTGTYPNPLIALGVVSTDKLADNAVTTPKIADNAVTSPKIADNGVTTTDIADDAVTAAKIAAQAVRASELGNTTLAVGSPVAIASNGNATASVACPAGSQIISGGGTTSNFQVFMVASFQSGNGWIVAYRNTNAAAQTITPIATCLVG